MLVRQISLEYCERTGMSPRQTLSWESDAACTCAKNQESNVIPLWWNKINGMSRKMRSVCTCSGKGLLCTHWSYVLFVPLKGVLEPSAGVVIPHPSNRTRVESLFFIWIGISNWVGGRSARLKSHRFSQGIPSNGKLKEKQRIEIS